MSPASAPRAFEIDVEVGAADWLAALPEAEALARRAAGAAAGIQTGGGMAVLLTDNQAVRDLNARFRDLDRPTNVLSFPAAANPEQHLGDIALAFGVCADEAKAQGKSLADHLCHLVVHGVLHLLGYDHQSDAEAERMESLERLILLRLGTADPYAEDGR